MPIPVKTEADADPVIRNMANRLRLSLKTSSLSPRIIKRVGLRSITDNRQLTLTIRNGEIEISSGISPPTEIFFSGDFSNLSATVRPEKIWRSPIMALRVNRLLTETLPDWMECANFFWARSIEIPELSNGLTVICEDDHRRMILGEGNSAIELHGNKQTLQQAFSGSSPISVMVAMGLLKFRGSMRDLAYLSNLGQRVMLGDGHG